MYPYFSDPVSNVSYVVAVSPSSHIYSVQFLLSLETLSVTSNTPSHAKGELISVSMCGGGPCATHVGWTLRYTCGGGPCATHAHQLLLLRNGLQTATYILDLCPLQLRESYHKHGKDLRFCSTTSKKVCVCARLSIR